ncbi:hypothetical protein AsFPU1_4134 [Aphanothece sacrum FPU1]|uniref:Uncharacterized protein n=2 Tax=Aphanothece sacrum TaxID=1122 RepID=A0A401IN58_APHSA|nr:hypothetical protein AsFPU1_4134 [Aphanothece sacrum FPU1]
MVEVYKSVLDTDEVFYCSSPVTSGKRYIDWLESIGKKFVDIDSADENYRILHHQEVITPNRQHAQVIIQNLRHKTGKIVVDPTALPHIPGWTQQDWRFFWQQVIEYYITTAFFINDWQYSNGCVYEFWVAQKKGIPTFSETQQPLNLKTGVNLINKAIPRLKKREGNTEFIEQVLQDLEKL